MSTSTLKTGLQLRNWKFTIVLFPGLDTIKKHFQNYKRFRPEKVNFVLTRP